MDVLGFLERSGVDLSKRWRFWDIVRGMLLSSAVESGGDGVLMKSWQEKCKDYFFFFFCYRCR